MFSYLLRFCANYCVHCAKHCAHDVNIVSGLRAGSISTPVVLPREADGGRYSLRVESLYVVSALMVSGVVHCNLTTTYSCL